MTVPLLAQTPELLLATRNGEQPFLVFEYFYCDAGNYKAFGEIWLIGSLSENERTALIDSLESNEFFVAEQLRVPSLCEQLYKVTGGRSRRSASMIARPLISAPVVIPRSLARARIHCMRRL